MHRSDSSRLVRRACVAIGAIAVVACHRDPTSNPARDPAPKQHVATDEAKRLLAELEARAKKIKHAPAPRPVASSEAIVDEVTTPETAKPSVETARDVAALPWILDGIVDVAPAGPASASPLGVLLYTSAGELRIARLGRLSRSAVAVQTPLRPLSDGSGPFHYGRGPALFQDRVYWIDHGELLRRRVTEDAIGPLEVLAKDAHDGTRPGVPLPLPDKKGMQLPAMVAYVVRPAKDDDPLIAKLWVEGAPSEVLTAEGNSTHSVSLVETDDGVVALSVQARMAMTPVHARRIRFPSGHTLLGDDVVVWVGGGIQPLTEMTVLPSHGNDLWGFIPEERSITEFGIARLDITQTPTMDTKTNWVLYPNGIDPAPVAAGHVCGEPVIVYAEPQTPAPESEQELVIRAVEDAAGERRATLAQAKGFAEVSIAEVEGGALVTWASNDATAARTVRCKKHAK
ncbi:MAG TPA: hypothetical protein VH142_14665 [Polyangiaceae bacterium]|nr:hypothetical protein [Polyangiaceae bacterium]